METPTPLRMWFMSLFSTACDIEKSSTNSTGTAYVLLLPRAKQIKKTTFRQNPEISYRTLHERRCSYC